MNTFYFVKAKDEEGANMIHKRGCENSPEYKDMILIGNFDKSEHALIAAQTTNPDKLFKLCENCC